MACGLRLALLGTLGAGCGPGLDPGESSAGDRGGPEGSEEDPDGRGDGATGPGDAGEASTSAGSGESSSGHGSEDEGGDESSGGGEPIFGDGEDECLGPSDFRVEVGACQSLGMVSLADVEVSFEGDDAWGPGELLTLTVRYAAGERDVDAPALVAQVDEASQGLVDVPWIHWNWFYVEANDTVEYVVALAASADLVPGTEVAVKLGAASQHGSLTQCDCPDESVASWTQSFVIE